MRITRVQRRKINLAPLRRSAGMPTLLLRQECWSSYGRQECRCSYCGRNVGLLTVGRNADAPIWKNKRASRTEKKVIFAALN